MGWQRADQTVHFKTLNGQNFSLRVHPTWKVIGIESLLEVLHGMTSPGSLRLIYDCRQLDHSATLRESGAQDGCTIHILRKMRGD